MIIFRFRDWFRVLMTGLLICTLLVVSAPISSTLLAAQQESSGTPDASPADMVDEVLTLEPVADAYVTIGDPEGNYGDASRLFTDRETYASTYFKFDVGENTRVVLKATLRLWVIDQTPHAPTVWLARDAIWSEEQLSWTNRPVVSWQVTEDDSRFAVEGAWIEYDITSAILGNGSYTFALVPESRDGLDIMSRETENPPQLVLELGAGEAMVSPVAPHDAPVLLAAGNIASCDGAGDKATAEILDEQPGTIAVLGDAVTGNGTDEEFVDCYEPGWGRHKERTLPVPGEVEYTTDGAEPFYAYFGDAAGGPARSYYSYDIGDWHVVVLNSNLEHIDHADQERWLVEDLTSSAAQCTVAYWHHPRFSSGASGSTIEVAPLYRILYDHGVEVLLTGHDSGYERFAPQDVYGARDLNRGIRQFVVGTGGAPLEDFNDVQQNSEVRNSDVHGVLRLDLYAGGYSWEFLSAGESSFFDGGSSSCHANPDPVTQQDTGRHREGALMVSEARRTSRAFVRRVNAPMHPRRVIRSMTDAAA